MIDSFQFIAQGWKKIKPLESETPEDPRINPNDLATIEKGEDNE